MFKIKIYIYISHIYTHKNYLDGMPNEPYIYRDKEKFSCFCCLLFLFNLWLFANYSRFSVSRFIVSQFLLLLHYTCTQVFMVQRFLLTMKWELFKGTFCIKVREMWGVRARSQVHLALWDWRCSKVPLVRVLYLVHACLT